MRRKKDKNDNEALSCSAAISLIFSVFSIILSVLTLIVYIDEMVINNLDALGVGIFFFLSLISYAINLVVGFFCLVFSLTYKSCKQIPFEKPNKKYIIMNIVSLIIPVALFLILTIIFTI